MRGIMSRRKRRLGDLYSYKHIETETNLNIKKLMPPEEGHFATLRKFDNPVLIKEERGLWVWRWLEYFGHDIRYGLRTIRRSSGFAAVAVLSLALGIGANTAIFSLIDALLLKRLPVQNPKQLLFLDWASQGWPDGIMNTLLGNVSKDKAGRDTSTSFSYPGYEHIRAENHVFSSVAAVAGDDTDWNVGYKGVSDRARGKLVSGTFFSTLGVVPIVGRALTPDDDRIGGSPVAVISYGYWERHFGRDRKSVV